MSQPPAQPASNPAQTYEDYIVPNQFRPWAGELLDRARPQPGERVLDLACGTGIVARLVAQRLKGEARVVGLDLNPAMIEVARSATVAEGVEIEWHVGRAGDLPFSDASFDLVLIQQGLQFFPDRAAAAREMYRVLTSGGRVVSATWTEISNHPFTQNLATVFLRHTGSSAMETPYSLGNRDELRAVFTGAGFADIEITVIRREVRFPSPDQFLNHFVTARTAGILALQTLDEADRTRLIEAISADMAGPVRQYTDDDAVAFPTEAHITIARKAA